MNRLSWVRLTAFSTIFGRFSTFLRSADHFLNVAGVSVDVSFSRKDILNFIVIRKGLYTQLLPKDLLLQSRPIVFLNIPCRQALSDLAFQGSKNILYPQRFAPFVRPAALYIRTYSRPPTLATVSRFAALAHAVRLFFALR